MVDLLTALVEKPAPYMMMEMPASPLGNALGNDFPTSQAVVEAEKVATPSKVELAKAWLIAHPGDMDKTGRELEQDARPEGVKISYRTWNDVKKELQR
jgi:hypothetical protein